MDFPSNQNPTFRLTSNLQGLEVRLPEIGWKKNKSELASLEVFGNINVGLQYDKFIISGEDLEVIGTGSDNETFILERLFRDDILDVSGFVCFFSAEDFGKLSALVFGIFLDWFRALGTKIRPVSFYFSVFFSAF